jgi:bacteriophage CI repressor helix-turn-helix domain
MKIVERLFQTLEEKKFKATDLAKHLNIQKSVISNWKTRGTNPPSELIVPICEFLGIDVFWLLTGNSVIKMPLNAQSDFFITTYPSLTSSEKEFMQNVLQSFLNFKNKDSKYEETTPTEETDVREINYYYKVASAGKGQLIFDTPPSEMIKIPNTYEYRKVNYAIGVNGDSMEPKFYDGDIVLVEITNDIHDGQIGIFDVDGECYIKQLKDKKLISFNKKYNDIPLTEYSRCLGKVIDVLS